METLIPELLITLKYLSGNGGKEVVKKTLNDSYDWLKGKLGRKSQQQKLEALKEKPDDQAAQKEVATVLQDAEADGELSAKELQTELAKAKTAIEQHDPQWLQKNETTIKNNSMHLSGTGNVGIQDISGSSKDVS